MELLTLESAGSLFPNLHSLFHGYAELCLLRSTELRQQWRAPGKLSPEAFSGQEAVWPEWSFVVASYFSKYSDSAWEMLSEAVTTDADISLKAVGEGQIKFAKSVHADLAMLCKGKALKTIRRAERQNCLQAWRLLVR